MGFSQILFGLIADFTIPYRVRGSLKLVNFGRARVDQHLAHMGQDGAKLEPRWRQDPPSWGQDGHLEAIWGAVLIIFGGLGSDL